MPVRSCLGIRKKITKSKNCMEKLWRKKTALVFSFVGYFIMNLYWFLCTCMYVEQIVIKNVSQEHMRPVFVYFLSECTSIYGYEYKKSEMFRKLNDHSINNFCLKNDDPWNPFLDKQHLIEWEALLILIFFFNSVIFCFLSKYRRAVAWIDHSRLASVALSLCMTENGLCFYFAKRFVWQSLEK